MQKLPSLAILIFCGMLTSGCTTSPVLPPDATVVFHGPMDDMKGSLPPGPATLYLVEADTGKVAGVCYIPGPDAGAHQGPTISGLKKGHVYTWYYASASTVP